MTGQERETIDGGTKPWDIEERGFQFALESVCSCRALEAQPGTAQILSRQLLRSGTSVGANLEEAHAGASRADFANKHAIALKEARETIYWLRLVSGSEIAIGDGYAKLTREVQELARIIGAILVSTRSRERS